MSRTIRSQYFHTNEEVKLSSPKNQNNVTRDGHGIGYTRLLAQRRAKDFVQKHDRHARNKIAQEIINSSFLDC